MRPPRPSLPHSSTALARFLHRRIDELRGIKSQREIAVEAGFARPNVISMLKSGLIKVPLDRIPALARAIEADPAHLFRLGMRDIWPELAPLVDTIFGRQMASRHELAIFLLRWRAATEDADPA